jgi:hypothetical protein
MTAATPPAMQPSGHPLADSEAAPAALRGAPLLVPTRIGLWVGVQLVVAGLLIVGGAAAVGDALNAAAAWWMVYAAIVDLGTLGVIGWLIRRQGVTYRSLLGPTAAVWQVALGAVGVLAATIPAVAYGTEVTKAFYGDATLPMFAMVDVPVWASVFAALVVPLLTDWPSLSRTWASCCRGWNGVSAGPGWPPRLWSSSGLPSTPSSRY